MREKTGQDQQQQKQQQKPEETNRKKLNGKPKSNHINIQIKLMV